MIATLHFLYMKENGTVVGTEMALVTFCCLPPYLTITTPIGSAWGAPCLGKGWSNENLPRRAPPQLG
jgi:hypothetical protein